MRIAVIGCGVVGSSWTLVFARAGFEVSLYDQSPAAVGGALAFVKGAQDDLAADRDASEKILTRLHPAASLEQALAGADYVQESVPEQVEIKRVLYQMLDTIVPPTTIIASSTSGLPVSSFTEDLKHRARCLAVHPINPPHLIPLVELVPSPWTDPAVTEKAAGLMTAVGQSPIRLNREINGFVVNRLQSAMLSEAFRLVEGNIVSAADVDKAVKDGLGLRWFFMGPFETIDLNARTGISEYCSKLGPMFFDLAKEQADPRPWGPELVARIEASRRALTPGDGLAARRAWRDRCLAAFVAAKNRVLGELGS